MLFWRDEKQHLFNVILHIWQQFYIILFICWIILCKILRLLLFIKNNEPHKIFVVEKRTFVGNKLFIPIHVSWSLIIDQKKWSKTLAPFSFIVVSSYWGKVIPFFISRLPKDLVSQFLGGRIPKTVILYFVALHPILNDQTSIKFLFHHVPFVTDLMIIVLKYFSSCIGKTNTKLSNNKT